jgi:hypothetical protein
MEILVHLRAAGKKFCNDARERNRRIARDGPSRFASAVLREDFSDWFELDVESPYILLVVDVAERRRRAMTEEEQALFGMHKLNVPRSDVTHLDYSARIQTGSQRDQPALPCPAISLQSARANARTGQHQLQSTRRAGRAHTRRGLWLFDG